MDLPATPEGYRLQATGYRRREEAKRKTARGKSKRAALFFFFFFFFILPFGFCLLPAACGLQPVAKILETSARCAQMS